MPEVVTCPQCERKLRVPQDLLGKKVKCPTCGTTFTAEAGGAASLPDEEEAPRPSRRSAAPPPEEQYEEEPRPSRRAPVRSRRDDDEDDDYDDEDDDRPRRSVRRRRRSGAAQDAVNGPGVGLIVTGVLGCVGQAAGIIMNLAGAGLAAGNARGAGNAMGGMVSGAMGVVFGTIGLLVGIFIIVAGTKMKQMQSYGLVMGGSIIAMIPCISPCCLLGLPIGIWALVILSKADVKDAFQG